MALETIFECLILLSLFLVLALLILTYRILAPKLPPGPNKLPIIGNLHQLGTLPHRSLFQLSRKHGPLMFLKLGSVPTVVASSAEAAKEFLKTHDLDCCSRPYLTSFAKLSYGFTDVASAPYGDEWRQLRKICIIEFFSSKRVLMFQSIRAEEIERMIESISNSHSTVNVTATVLSLANDITCRSALGKRYYDSSTGKGSRLQELLEETQAMIGGFFFADYIPALGWLDSLTGMRARLQKNFSDLDSFYEKVIDEHMDPKRRQQSGGEDTMDALLRIHKDATHLTKEHIKALLMNILVGGSETSSTALDWTMVELMRNPRAMKKAQDEVRGLIGNKGKVEERDLPQLHYLKCVVKEAMRMHPPLPLLVFRETMRHFNIEGFSIPARTRVIINAWAIGRETNFWKMSEEFKPERFMDSSIDLKGHDFQLIPFGAGRRICPGMHVALVIIELALSNLLYSFNWKLPQGVSKEEIVMDEAAGVTVRRRSALHLRATSAFSSSSNP